MEDILDIEWSETLKKLLSDEELQLLEAFDRADDDDRKIILRVAESIAGGKSKG
jgi:tRNA A37 threonylcarbamoyladenosine biosynthesis protein TsaE